MVSNIEGVGQVFDGRTYTIYALISEMKQHEGPPLRMVYRLIITDFADHVYLIADQDNMTDEIFDIYCEYSTRILTVEWDPGDWGQSTVSTDLLCPVAGNPQIIHFNFQREMVCRGSLFL